jgi:hypothetical protein
MPPEALTAFEKRNQGLQEALVCRPKEAEEKAMRKFGPTLIALALAVALPSTEYAKGAQRGAIEGAERIQVPQPLTSPIWTCIFSFHGRWNSPDISAR